jgi:ATPase subunit of ABC transporter with duplicated ATPase domains
MALEKYRAAEGYVAPPPKDKRFRFRFPPVPRCGLSIVEAHGLGHGYGTGKYQTLFRNVDIQVDRGMRVGFIGPNGSGKSTMMKIIQGIESPREGWCEFGSANVVQTYFQQNQADALDLERTVLETVLNDAPTSTSLTDIRALLGQFMFKGDDVDKKLRVLSGGEKARVALAKMMLTSANLLLLDEPTNHLDITAKEVLEDALVNYEGSVLCISHDRYFMSQIANTIFSFGDKSMVKHDCDYHDFMHGEDAPKSLKAKVERRYVYGDKYRIAPAKEVVVKEEKDKKKRNFGGSGAPCGNLNKGIKNAKRFK